MAITYDAQENIDALTQQTCYMKRATSGGTVFTTIATNSTVFDYFTDTAVVNDAFYIGCIDPGFINQTFWTNPVFNVGTALAAVAITVAYEYCNTSSAWVAMPNVIDNTNIFRNVGSNGIYFEHPLNWYGSLSVGGTYAFWFRIRITAITTITEGGANSANKVKLNNGHLYNNNTTSTSFSNLYTAEKAGTKELLCPVPASTYSLYTQPRPMEWGSTKLSIIVTGYSVVGTVVLTGTDQAGNSITETITVNANGTYISALSYKTIGTNGVVITGTYTTQITQPRWGAVGYDQGYRYTLNRATFVNGDNINNSPFSESSKSIYLYNSSIYNRNYSVITFGTLSSGFLQYPLSISYETLYVGGNFNYVIAASASAIMYFYNTNIEGVSNATRVMAYGGTIRGCKMSNIYDLILNSKTISLSDTSVNYTPVWSFASYDTGTEFFDLKSENIVRGVLTIVGSTINHNDVNIQKWTRLNSIGCTYDITLYGAGVGAIFKDPLFTPISSKISMYQAAGTVVVLFIDYSFNLKIVDINNNPVQSANIVLKDKNGNLIINTVTDINGVIVGTYITTKYWQTTIPSGATIYRTMSDSDIVDNGPFTLFISKSGYKTYKSKMTISNKFDETITLQKVLNINMSNNIKLITQ